MPDLRLVSGGRVVRTKEDAQAVMEAEFSRFVEQHDQPPRYMLVNPRVLVHLIHNARQARRARRRVMQWNGVEVVACPVVSTAIGVLSSMEECSRYLEETR